MPLDFARLLKAVYGSTSAPREFYKDVEAKVEADTVGAIPIIGDACV